MNVFNTAQEKGVGEWKSVGNILHEKRAGLFPVGKQKIVHLNVRPGRAFHQEFFILKNAR